MACKQRDRRCQICHRLIALKRCRTYPTAVLCGGRDCYAEHYRRRHNQASMLYQRRQRLAKKNLAQRAPQTNGLATVDTFPAENLAGRGRGAVWAGNFG